jgi:hypothetical protein
MRWIGYVSVCEIVCVKYLRARVLDGCRGFGQTRVLIDLDPCQANGNDGG